MGRLWSNTLAHRLELNIAVYFFFATTLREASFFMDWGLQLDGMTSEGGMLNFRRFLTRGETFLTFSEGAKK